VQLSLLDQFGPCPDESFAGLSRRQLEGDAWVDYSPQWMAGQRAFLDLMVETCDWEKHRRVMYDRLVDVPRLVAGAPGSQWDVEGDDGMYEQLRHTASAARVEEARAHLARMAAMLSVRYRRVLDSVSLGFYRDGRDSVSFHGDKMGTLRKDTVVAIVSVGAPRNFLLRPARAREGRTHSYRFGQGDLLVMGGTCQDTWEHAVPKMAHAGPRVSIMFREKVPSPVRRSSEGTRQNDAWRNVSNSPSARWVATGRE